MVEPVLNIVRSSDFVKKKRGKTIDDIQPPVTEPKNLKNNAKEVKGKSSIWKNVKYQGEIPKSFPKENKANGKFRTKERHRAPNRSDSLFFNNPPVPEIIPEPVTPLNEPVFSALTFDKFDLHSHLVKNLADQKLTTATAVQAKVIPKFLQNKDLLVQSQTGSGKTLAFALPIVHLLMTKPLKLKRSDGIRAIVVVPTRELATQTYQIFELLTKACTWIVAGVLTGGEKRKAEKARLRKGITILISTPGRLLDHIKHTECLAMNTVEFLVIDEADRLLDMGYEKDVSEIIAALGINKIATSLYSATLTEGVERLAGLALKKPKRISCIEDEQCENKVEEAILALPDTLQNEYVVTPAKLRLATLAAFIASRTQLGSKLIVFVATIEMVELHSVLLRATLSDNKVALHALHGNMAQQSRREAHRAFRNAAKAAVLISTDVAARGLDLPNVDWVIHYTAPTSVEEYIHRSGRTARSGHSGSSLLFLTPSEVNFIRYLEQHRVLTRQRKLEDLLEEAACYLDARSIQETATKLQHTMEGVIEDEQHIRDLACRAFASWTRFYSTYPRNLKSCFSLKLIHLGHYAKSFALKETPSAAFRIARPEKKEEEPKVQKHTSRKRMRDDGAISEFSSGLDPMPKKHRKIGLKGQ